MKGRGEKGKGQTSR